MKINRFFALAMFALLIIGAMGVVSARALARANTAASVSTYNLQDGTPSNAPNAPDTDTIEEQNGDQNAPDVQESVTDTDTDTTEVQQGDQNASDTAQGQDIEDADSSDGQETAPTGSPAITADQAKTAALAAHSGTVVKSDLDDENGKLIYSVQFSDGVEVKVDAMTGVVVGTGNGQD
jgi:uncharacterized membrane protein YkoI